MNFNDLISKWNNLNSDNKFDVFSMNLKSLLKLIEDDNMVLENRYQRDSSVWNESDVKELMISLKNGLPIPSIYLYFDEDEKAFSPLDGLQRLTSIKNANNDPKGVSKWNVTDSDWDVIKELMIPVILFRGNGDDYADLFEKINTTGSKANNQEVRRSSMQDSKIRNWILNNEKEINKFTALLSQGGTKTFSENQVIRQQTHEFILWLMTIEKAVEIEKIKNTDNISLDKIYEEDFPPTASEWKMMIDRIEKIKNAILHDELKDYSKLFNGKAQIFNIYSMLKFGYILDDAMTDENIAKKLNEISKKMSVEQGKNNKQMPLDGFKIKRTTIQTNRMASLKVMKKYS